MESNDKVFYYHSRPEIDHTGQYNSAGVSKSGRRISIAAIITSDKTMRIGISVCCKKDHFTRAMGRTIAAGRAEQNPIVVIQLTQEDIDSGVGKKFLSEARKILSNDTDYSAKISAHSSQLETA